VSGSALARKETRAEELRSRGVEGQKVGIRMKPVIIAITLDNIIFLFIFKLVILYRDFDYSQEVQGWTNNRRDWLRLE
jgi:hypothetical protein